MEFCCHNKYRTLTSYELLLVEVQVWRLPVGLASLQLAKSELLFERRVAPLPTERVSGRPGRIRSEAGRLSADFSSSRPARTDLLPEP